MTGQSVNHQGGPSLRRRALLAIALTATFYLLAIAVALGLIVAPVALWISSGRGNIWVALAMVGAGLAILRAIIPERDRFDPPGPELRREEHPHLHAVLDEVAAAAGEPPADDVYLDLPVNASVLEHRGRRAMLLGLPLLATLDDQELRAVVAHEYGHYAGGDTRFSTWIWRTRVAVLKTVQSLAESESWFRRNLVRWPFQGYALLFLRITNAISRRAEFAADSLSARVTSPEATGSALRRIEALAPAFDGYWASDVAPMLEEERRPPIAAGFAAMAAHTEFAATLDDVVRSDIEAREPDPYASHPTLRQRLEALGVSVDDAAPEPVAHPASEMLEDLPGLERQLLTERFGDEIASFKAAGWEDAPAVHLSRLRSLAERYGRAFPAALSVAAAGAAAADLPARREALRELLPREERDAPDELLDDLLLQVLGGLVMIAAADAGAKVTATPGEPIRIHHGSESLDPWQLLVPIAAGDAPGSGWSEHPVVQALGQAPLRPAV